MAKLDTVKMNSGQHEESCRAQCPKLGESGKNWFMEQGLILLLLFLAGILVGVKIGMKIATLLQKPLKQEACHTNLPYNKQTRDKMSQCCVTFTEVRKCKNPRFHLLAHNEHG